MNVTAALSRDQARPEAHQLDNAIGYPGRMDQETLVVVTRVLAALLVGGVIGLERSFRGRPAGFRTHSLVCIASALLLLVTVYQGEWMTAVPAEAIRTDPTRMAQGIMTGIGFLGAGVIFREGLTVRGLTTSASIWVTAAIGFLVGIGLYVPALVGTVATVLILSAFRAVERRLPGEYYAHHTLKFERGAVMPEEDVRALVGRYGFSVANLSHRLADGGAFFEYRMVIRSRDRDGAERLLRDLRAIAEV